MHEDGGPHDGGPWWRYEVHGQRSQRIRPRSPVEELEAPYEVCGAGPSRVPRPEGPSDARAQVKRKIRFALTEAKGQDNAYAKNIERAPQVAEARQHLRHLLYSGRRNLSEIQLKEQFSPRTMTAETIWQTHTG